MWEQLGLLNPRSEKKKGHARDIKVMRAQSDILNWRGTTDIAPVLPELQCDV